MWNPTELWLEGAVMAVLHAAGPEQGYWVEDTGLLHDDGSALVRAPYGESGGRLFEDCTDPADLREAYRLADAAFDAARAGTLDAAVLLPVLRRADPEPGRRFDIEAALAVAARAGLTPGTSRPALPGASRPEEAG
ncbi:hypothetical protein HEK616_30060 [Streptomyces nigrescens]|uniref:Uncharacterized protein n=1 Tax=Streptomyces nigrescens TaxID=1920 RepID=A0ABM7ZTP9_STRNI|nr:hypothetical protein [Streptomyces nigrescens]BDM69519.1 hypothetical protein HEK616_30060 [Streptomyces nigrescens]